MKLWLHKQSQYFYTFLGCVKGIWHIVTVLYCLTRCKSQVRCGWFIVWLLNNGEDRRMIHVQTQIRCWLLSDTDKETFDQYQYQLFWHIYRLHLCTLPFLWPSLSFSKFMFQRDAQQYFTLIIHPGQSFKNQITNELPFLQLNPS